MMLEKIKYASYFAMVVALAIPHFAVHAQDLPAMVWSDRVANETSDGDIVETAPFVEIGTVRLSRFSQMQSLELQETLRTGKGDEVLHVFRAWQGGASQGEQLMLVTTSEKGLDVIGPHEQDFESMFINPASGDFGPIFELYGADTNKPLERLEYFDGQLIQLNSN